MEVLTVRQPLNDSLNMGSQSLQNFREDLWVDDNGTVRPISSPFMLTNSLDEEVKRLEAAYINLPCDEDEEESQPPPSPLTDVSETVTTPPLSPCTASSSPDSVDSPFHLPTSLETPFLFSFSLSLGRQTVSPYEIFSPLPQVDDSVGDVAMEESPPAPAVPTKSLPELLNACSDATLPSSPSPPPSPPQSPPVAGPSRSAPKRLRWSKDGSDNESDDFTPQKRKPAHPGRRPKGGSTKRTSDKGTKCDLCGERLGRVTDLPRHKASCKKNPGRVMRKTPCEFCGKPLPVRTDAAKRHQASKTCLSKRKKDDDEDPYPSES